MHDSYSTHSQCRFGLAVALLLPILASAVAAQENAKSGRVQIGEVLGKAVYRDEISSLNDMHHIFTTPVMQKYRREHKADTEPTEEELDFAAAYFERMYRERLQNEGPQIREQLRAVEEKLSQPGLSKEQQQALEAEKQGFELKLTPPGRGVAVFVLDGWKFQRHLYDQFGGGCIVWQQVGVQAFDATYKWLLAQEAAGEFKITDPRLRTWYYSWTKMDPPSFLISGKDRIRDQFLERRVGAEASKVGLVSALLGRPDTNSTPKIPNCGNQHLLNYGGRAFATSVDATDVRWRPT